MNQPILCRLNVDVSDVPQTRDVHPLALVTEVIAQPFVVSVELDARTTWLCSPSSIRVGTRVLRVDIHPTPEDLAAQ